MGGDTGISRRARQVFTFDERNVDSLRVLETLGEPEVDDVDVIFGEVSSADEEVIRFNVSVDDAFFVHFLQALHQLLGHQAARLQVELAFALREQVLQTGPEHVHDHNVELVLLVRFVRADIVQLGNEGLSSQLVD
eukprot:CAMPEP_0170483394 /NCGR_PEP_ID=MMETSP0208-20121228/3081_1 /TAXON_ID=197538 /ORGANISM="Strombidium inclinatum, Strain S3" /LENGTH=135 /DNA_ID=CAMNT_0010756411 /DNA_START=602 /DNA_END=1009 /DNA_ORIENTATION=+